MLKIHQLHQYAHYFLLASAQCKLSYVTSLFFKRKVQAERHRKSDACSFNCDIRLIDRLSASPQMRASWSPGLATLLRSYDRHSYENFALTFRAFQIDY